MTKHKKTSTKDFEADIAPLANFTIEFTLKITILFKDISPSV